ncbi:hypothetical protein [Limobrevibacterium gyesilva]|uniref:Uncharacterized protein n=1 Tax=Limobrevibacterium gyesilva TaxID=2991712 RepID=A0AA41YP87_9PROT|nr:hypothetical protein [Limobrevibacterium gyesilva]MCW3476186.1 hypothetical protein [Limobrevibacterium gyesilva]
MTEAFFAALNEIPEARQAEVAKAAQSAIRDALKVARDKAKAAQAAERKAGKANGAKTNATKRKAAAARPAKARKVRAAA